MLLHAKSRSSWNVDPVLKELRHNPIFWPLILVPGALIAAKLVPAAHTLLFVLSVLAIVPPLPCLVVQPNRSRRRPATLLAGYSTPRSEI
jgi:Ca2+:H+ antiporter